MKHVCATFRGGFLPGFILLSTFALSLHSAEPRVAEPAKSVGAALDANQAAKTFALQEGFEMQLLASEPMVTEPVAMAYDENGLAYVAEMVGYPAADKSTGRIKVLQDTDGDGAFDQSHIFTEGLLSPAGVACWKGGVYVAAGSEIWYLKDTSGDHKADEKRKVFTGFGKGSAINNLVWGIDNRIYGSGAGKGCEVTTVGSTNAAVTLPDGGFRFDPAKETIEAASGGAGFGNAQDDWGHRFVCDGRIPVQFVVLESWYLSRTKGLPNVVHLFDAAADAEVLPNHRISPVEAWRDGSKSTSDRYTEPRRRGRFGRASGVTIYRGDAYPEQFRGSAVTADPQNNLVQRWILTTNGFVFKATAADEKQAFVASTDSWFRPVNFVNAPDGTLHVIDMCRGVIDSPAALPEGVKSKLNFEQGSDHGRIFRLAPSRFKVPNGPQLGKGSTAELVACLEKQGGWWRDTAQRLIVERRDKAAVQPLRDLLLNSKSQVARLHALWTLSALGALTDDDLQHSLADPSPGMRAHALKLGEPRMDNASLAERMLSLAQTEDRQVRFQAALTLGSLFRRTTGQVLSTIVRRDPGDPWLRLAILSSGPEMAVRAATWLLREEAFASSDEGRTWLQELMFTLGAQYNKENLYEIMNLYGMVHYCECYVRGPFFCGLGEGLRAAGKNFRNSFPTNSIGTKVLNGALSYGMEVAPMLAESIRNRSEAIEFLSYDDCENVTNVLGQVLDAPHPDTIKALAILALGSFSEREALNMILSRWNNLSPAVRESITQVFLDRKERVPVLLDAVESGAIARESLSRHAKSTLLANPDSEIRGRAGKLFAPSASGPRSEVVEKYKTVLSLKGNPDNGARIYQNQCAVCHVFGDKGSEVGPKLDSVLQWDEQKILAAILDPNRELAPRYAWHDINLTDGRSIRGLITGESPMAFTFLVPGTPARNHFRQNIAGIVSSGTSLMADGFETELPPQDMADLLAFLIGKN